MSEGDPKLTAATLDGPCRVTVRLNRRVPVADWPAPRFSLKTTSSEAVPLKSVEAWAPRQDQTTTFVLATAEPLDFVQQQFDVWVEGAGSRLVSVRDVLLDPERYGDPEARLGFTYRPEATTFRVFAPTATGVEVVIADAVAGDAGLVAHEMQRNERGVWEAIVAGNLDGKYYAYRLRGFGFNPKTEVGDVYAVCTQGRHARTLILDLAATDPPGFREHAYANPASAVDVVVYEMHVRDFTIAANSGVTRRGKFLGLTESGTHLPDDPSIRTGLDHLVELGVTHVQLMPVQDFDNAEDRDDEYDWGYMPVQFNSPDGWYASSVSGPARIRELKQAIQALHERGIGVILDVVYNHAAKTAPFERLVPHYYYRKTPADRFCNGSGCGNEFMSEAPMARKFILDSLEMWVREYRVDGFRFDLMGLIDLQMVRRIKAELTQLRPDILLWGEPWAAGPTPLKPVTDKRQLRGTGVACFNDPFRDAIKGDRDEGPPGFIQAGVRIDAVKRGLEGAVREWAEHPTDCISYFECHDNLTAWDKLLQTSPEASEAELERMARLAALLLFASQGIVLLHAGQEFGRTKRGHRNSYNLPDAINQVDWALKLKRKGLFDYYRGLIALRKAHPAFRLRQRADVEYRVWFGDTPHGQSIAHILHSAELPGEPAQAIVVLYNGSNEPTEFKLGEGLWSVHADADRAGLEPLDTVQDCVTIPGHSGVMLCR
ncbi:MAG: type I pullulanase [Planctomycetes bacterium]|nr:type I pullulanase [Planctomycetota bacterium]